MSAFRILAERVSKTYSRSAIPRVRRWRDLVTCQWNSPAARKLSALHDVSFSVGPGEMLGVIGGNGAGKSTLLRLLGGVGRPTSGRVEVHGKIGALLDLGGGFIGDLTGRENAILAGVAAGMTRAQFLDRLPEVVEFAELGEFIDSPLHTYSSGMAMRLAFSVAVHTDPEVLLVDEFLSVGDLAFQAKCLGRIRELQKGGCAIVLISHSMDQIRQMCDRVLWLRNGAVAALDTPEVVTRAFETAMNAETIRRTRNVPPRPLPGGGELRMHENRFGSLEVEITGATLRPNEGLKPGDPLDIEIEYSASQQIKDAIFVVTISRNDSAICLDTNTQISGVAVPELKGAGKVRLRIGRVDLGAGNYFVDLGIYEQSWAHA